MNTQSSVNPSISQPVLPAQWDDEDQLDKMIITRPHCALHTRSHLSTAPRYTSLVWALLAALDPRYIRLIELTIPENTLLGYHNKSP